MPGLPVTTMIASRPGWMGNAPIMHKILPIKKPPHLMKRLPGSKFLGLYQQLPNSIQIITKTTIVPKQPPPSFFAP